MSKQSFTEELKEYLGALEAKLEAAIGENIKLLGDLRYYEEMRMPELERQLAKAQAEIDELNAEIERLKGVVISQITPEPIVLSSYSTTAEPAKDERDKLIEQMREALEAVVRVADRATVEFDMARAAIKAAKGEI